MVIEWNFVVEETEYMHKSCEIKGAWLFPLSHLFVDISYAFMKLISCFIFHLFLPVESWMNGLSLRKYTERRAQALLVLQRIRERSNKTVMGSMASKTIFRLELRRASLLQTLPYSRIILHSKQSHRSSLEKWSYLFENTVTMPQTLIVDCLMLRRLRFYRMWQDVDLWWLFREAFLWKGWQKINAKG